MTAAHAFTDAELTLIGKLIEDRCPPGEIAKTVGCQPWTIRDRFPASRMTRAERAEYASLCAEGNAIQITDSDYGAAS